MTAIPSREPFRFFTKMHLSELTGLKASNLAELADLLRRVPGSCVYHHTHRFLQQHLFLNPEPPNDFSYWVGDSLGEDELGEQLASIDIVRFESIRSLREAVLGTIEAYTRDHPKSLDRFCRDGEEFHFIKAVSFVFPTEYVAGDRREFAAALEKVAIESIYFHMFEARLRLEKASNDFSAWFESSLGEPALAAKINRIDPYTHTLEDLRAAILGIVR